MLIYVTVVLLYQKRSIKLEFFLKTLDICTVIFKIILSNCEV